MTEVLLALATSVGPIAGLAIGYVAGRRSRPPAPLSPAPPSPEQALCGCGHHLAMHDPQTGRCHDVTEVDDYDDNGAYVGPGTEDCRCRQYSGPRPIDQVFAPPMLPPAA